MWFTGNCVKKGHRLLFIPGNIGERENYGAIRVIPRDAASVSHGMEWNDIKWIGMTRNGMKWHEMTWNDME